ncbi:hypothetical protein QR98_0091020 [Sarcoptes scabiei]|uniref:Uncharacterized protein n=1 Tax=Sarcoptes scabiei TaxID=52283 RepID=A0A132AHS8_SARSC|nr:hypothetical protein QR98_0091020 [Sarcoptes scabiei]
MNILNLIFFQRFSLFSLDFVIDGAIERNTSVALNSVTSLNDYNKYETKMKFSSQKFQPKKK